MMIKEIVRDPIFLAQKSQDVSAEDVSIADDMLETLNANADKCVGMAANMIGTLKKIIVFDDNGKYTEMFNPEIISAKEPYETEEGCLSLEGMRKVKRYKTIKVKWQNRQFRTRTKNFTGFTAQIIQHEIDHFSGKLI